MPRCTSARKRATSVFDAGSAELSGREKVLAHNVLYDATTWRGTFSAIGDLILAVTTRE